MPDGGAPLVMMGATAMPLPFKGAAAVYAGFVPSPARKPIVVVPLDDPVLVGTKVTVTPHDVPGASVRLTAHGVPPLPTAVNPSPVVVKPLMV